MNSSHPRAIRSPSNSAPVGRATSLTSSKLAIQRVNVGKTKSLTSPQIKPTKSNG